MGFESAIAPGLQKASANFMPWLPRSAVVSDRPVSIERRPRYPAIRAAQPGPIRDRKGNDTGSRRC